MNYFTDAHTTLYLNNDTESLDPYFQGTGGLGDRNPETWAELIALTTQKLTDAGRKVVSVAPFNEPDCPCSFQGDQVRFGEIASELRSTYPAFDYGASDFIRIMGGNTLNNDAAAEWYNPLNDAGLLEEGNTHQLAGNFWTYRDFHINVQNNGDVGTNDELHNVMEAMVGAQYGMDNGIWWGTAGRARSEFMKTSDGMRLAYSENPWNWTAASVYRAPEGQVQAFVGESERQALPTTFRFVSRDRPVFYDGYGPTRFFDVTTSGDPGYQTPNHKNAERVVNITWGEDVQPVIDGRYVLVNRASGEVMEVIGGNQDNGAFMRQTGFTGADYQQWEVHPIPRTRGGDYSYFKFAAGHSGKAPDVYGFSLSDGGDIRQWEQATNPDWPYPGDNQMWFLEYVEDGYFKIGSGWSGLYMSTDGAKIVQLADNGQYNQQWRLVPADAIDPTDLTPPAKPKGVDATADDVSVWIKWNANKEDDLAGYNVLRSATSGGPYEIIARLGSESTSYTDNTANQTMPYYYTVVAVDKALNRSARSGQTGATPTGEPTLVAQYGFQMDALDDSINENDAVLAAGASYTPGGLDGSALALNGEGYVRVPSEVVNYDQVTIATWVYWRGGESWQRIFDFGNGTGEYLFLTPANWSGNTMQFSIVKSGVGGHDMYTSALPVQEWAHVAVVLGDGTAELYVNGVLEASTGTSIKPSDFNPLVNYIGKSQWPDPLFNGAIDDFRIYNYALSDIEVAELASDSPVDPPGVAKIPLDNADFDAGVGNWDSGFTSFDFPAQDVPGWMDYAAGTGGVGVEAGNAWWGTHNGSFSSWMSPGGGGYLQSLYTIQPGDVFDVGFVAKTWAGWDPNWETGEWTATLFYDNPANVIGSYTTTTTRDWEEYSSTIPSTPDSVGGLLGILIENTGTSNFYPNIDSISVGLVLPETAPPVLVKADPKWLWPANHMMQDVDLKVSFFDEGVDPVALGLTLACSISSNEPDDGADDGNTTGDVDGSDGYWTPVPVTLLWDGADYVGTVQLRAERSDSGSGREYSISCVLTEPGKEATATDATVSVPLN